MIFGMIWLLTLHHALLLTAGQASHRNNSVLPPSVAAAVRRGLTAGEAEELSLFSDEMWQVMSGFYDHCEELGNIPTIWRCVRQVHIPKGKPPEADGSMLADNMRPIAVMSIIWRICSRARFKQTEVQEWIHTSTPEFMFGGIPQKGVEDAISHIILKDMHSWPVGTLDLTKAFDYSDPEIICKLFVHQGMPRKAARMLLSMWSEQIRFLSSMTIFSQTTMLSSAPCRKVTALAC